MQTSGPDTEWNWSSSGLQQEVRRVEKQIIHTQSNEQTFTVHHFSFQSLLSLLPLDSTKESETWVKFVFLLVSSLKPDFPATIFINITFLVLQPEPNSISLATTFSETFPGTFILLLIFLNDDPSYLLNFVVESVGFYANHALGLGLHAGKRVCNNVQEFLWSYICCQNAQMRVPTPRFDLLNTEALPQKGNAPDKKENPEWMASWTIFYWGWWIAWSPFVGMFVAKISKGLFTWMLVQKQNLVSKCTNNNIRFPLCPICCLGRTIREFICYNMFLTVGYVFLWFCILSGVALKEEREGELQGNITNSLGCVGNATKLSLMWVHCREPTQWVVELKVLTINLESLSNCREIDDMWFYVVSRHDMGGFSFWRHISKLHIEFKTCLLYFLHSFVIWTGNFLSILSLIGMMIYFVTSSDSASLVIDSICANGEPDPPVVQRILWAVTEGACASALLRADYGRKTLEALQVLSVWFRWDVRKLQASVEK